MSLTHRALALAMLLASTVAVQAQPTIAVEPAAPEPYQPFTITVDEPMIACAPVGVELLPDEIVITNHSSCACLPGVPLPPLDPVVVEITGLPEQRYTVRYRRLPNCESQPEPQQPEIEVSVPLPILAGQPPSLHLVPSVPIAHSPFAVYASWEHDCATREIDVSQADADGIIRVTLFFQCDFPGPEPTLVIRAIPIEQRLEPGRYRVELWQIREQSSVPPEPAMMLAERPFLVAYEGGIVDFEVLPADPTEDDLLTLELSVPCNDQGSQFTLDRIEGNVIRIDHFRTPAPDLPCDSAIEPYRTIDVSLGRLPANSYVVLVEQPDSDALSFAEVIEVAPGMSETLVLRNGRFEVRAGWATAATSGAARARPLTGSGDAGAFWFFRPENAEVLVKVLDGCASNGHFWVFAAGLTNVAVDLTVTDTVTGVERSYPSPLGTDFEPIQDTRAFDTCDASMGGAS